MAATATPRMVTTMEMVASRSGTLQRQSPIGTRILMPTVNSAISSAISVMDSSSVSSRSGCSSSTLNTAGPRQEADHQVDHRRAHRHAIEKPP